MKEPLDYRKVGSMPPERNRRGIMPWVSLTAMVGVWLVPVVIVIVLAATTDLFEGPGQLLWLGVPFLTGFVIYTVYRIVHQMRRRNGQIIVGYLEMAVRLNLPLAPFLLAALRVERGKRAAQLMTVYRALDGGAPVADALARAPHVPEKVVLRVAAAEPMGNLREALGRSVEEARRESAEAAERPDAGIYRVYPVALFLVIWGLLTFIVICILPKFREIFRDYRTTLPRLSQLVFGVSGAASDNWPIVLGVSAAIFLIMLTVMTVMTARTFSPRIPLPDFVRMGRWLAWRLPLAHGFQRDQGMAEVCGLLAEAQRGSIPLPAALERAVQLPINAGLRQQLERFRDLLLAGKVPADAARQAGLPELMAGLLGGAGRAPDADLFSFLERYYRNRFSRAFLLLRGALEPAMVISFAIVVCTVVLALFLPLVKLLSSVEGDGW